jgi:hypothetical protein
LKTISLGGVQRSRFIGPDLIAMVDPPMREVRGEFLRQACIVSPRSGERGADDTFALTWDIPKK